MDKKEQERQEEFVKKYRELCDSLGYEVSAVPTWTPTNHGTFEMSLQFVVVKLQTKQQL